MNPTPLIILGAGATKAAGGPMTNEILPRMFGPRTASHSERPVDTLERLLVEVFAVPAGRKARSADSFPPLPLLLSLIDTAIDRKEPIAPQWNPERLAQVRREIEYSFYRVLRDALSVIKTNPHEELFTRIKKSFGTLPIVISLNYDLLADNTLLDLSGPPGQRKFADFACDISTDVYRNNRSTTPLLKIHGSLSWLYCPSCHRMDVAISAEERATMKVFPELVMEKRFDPIPCENCSASMGSVMITPTYRKDYRNAHISRIWYEAERALRDAQRVIVIGYSLPEDDVEVIYLLKRGLQGIDPKNITVVEKKNKEKRHLEVAKRYRQLFGETIDWQEDGFDGWLSNVDEKLLPIRKAAPHRRARISAGASKRTRVR